MEVSTQDSQTDALQEGRRIYLGNLLYRVKPYEIEEALAANGFGELEQIHISIDPVSARNPGYCFVDFRDRATAERALASLRATICGRPCKVGPCEPKKRGGGGGGRSRPVDDPGSSFQRWGDWKTPRRENGGVAIGKLGGAGSEQGPYAALDHFTDLLDDDRGRRLYVGGLGKMVDQAQNQEEMRALFAGFNPGAIGKRITADAKFGRRPGNHNFCFVDFETAGEADAARTALDGKPYLDGYLRVTVAKTTARKLNDVRPDVAYFRQGDYIARRRAQERVDHRVRGQRSVDGDWRRRDNGD